MVTCIIIEDNMVQSELLKGYIEEIEGIQLQKVIAEATEATNYLKNNEVDLIFLDIELPIMNGFELLKNTNWEGKIIITSSEEKYAIESYSYNVIDYLVKPISFSKFLGAVQKAEKYMGISNKATFTTNELFVKANSVIQKIVLANILYIMSEGDYIKIITPDKSYLVNTTMKDFLKRVSENEFIRVHRSFIIRIDKINKIDGTVIEIDKHLIPISKSYKENLMRKLKIL